MKIGQASKIRSPAFFLFGALEHIFHNESKRFHPEWNKKLNERWQNTSR